MLITAISFAYVTICLFSLVRLWLLLGTSVLSVSINTLCWIAFYSSVMYGNIHMGHFCTREAMETANLLHKIAHKDKLKQFSEKILLFSQQLNHRIPVFSCGLFTFDLSLAFQVSFHPNS